MTDQALLPPVLAPRPASTAAERRLSERIFLLARTRALRVPSLHPRHGGLALCGPDAVEKLRELRRRGHSGLLIADPAFYENDVATDDQPFTFTADDLFGHGLDRELELQLDSGATVALTPTRYLRAGDRGALRAVVTAAQDIDRVGTVVMIPAAVGWLLDSSIDLFLPALASIPHPVAIALGGQFNPLDSHRKATTNLRRLLLEVPGTALWRTDLAAFDSIAHGGPFASFGLTTALRHIIPPDEKPQNRNGGGPVPPTVLLPELLRFSSGPALAKRYAGLEAPTCTCQVCRGAGLNRFDGYDGDTRAQADAHNVAVWNELLSALFSLRDLGNRQAWWRRLCMDAVNAHETENIRIRQAGAFKPPKDVKRWVDLPVTHSPAPLPAAAPDPHQPGTSGTLLR
ncbi:hypothetical protein [Frankia tisae]|uniref:hypothetical protein n=1 Tax=Frankia tisae TaxID=2950104 RepID=UPI0021BE8148|nr:hypothetical protein [Frankia tisae]